eukprot:jgi/Psemu1/316037/fgenesh1_kg.2706_\
MSRLSLLLSSFLALLAFLAMPQTTVASRSLSAHSVLSVSALAFSSMPMALAEEEPEEDEDDEEDDDDDDDDIIDDDDDETMVDDDDDDIKDEL